VFYEGFLANTRVEVCGWRSVLFFRYSLHLFRDSVYLACSLNFKAESISWTVVLSWNEFSVRGIIVCNFKSTGTANIWSLLGGADKFLRDCAGIMILLGCICIWRIWGCSHSNQFYSLFEGFMSTFIFGHTVWHVACMDSLIATVLIFNFRRPKIRLENLSLLTGYRNCYSNQVLFCPETDWFSKLDRTGFTKNWIAFVDF
jgi:hypothetical protein